MPVLKKVICRTCKKMFDKNAGHINENLKLGHNFYCSRKCEYQYKTKSKELSCENCRKIFTKQPNDILAHNYCSRSCAAKINNRKYPKRTRAFTLCLSCRGKFKRDGKYCSRKCSDLAKVKFTDKEILKLIRVAYGKLKRVPTKRELREIAEASRKHFGSWNKAIVAAGLIPHRSHDHRMYKRMNTKAIDGHLCDSISEAIVDNWLTEHNILHARNVSYPNSNHRADWALNDNVFVEYFGLFNDSPRYDRSVKKKRNLCRKYGIKLIEVTAKDLYPVRQLDTKLANVVEN